MKKVLFATTALVLTAGVAAAEVTVGGDGRMGVIYDGSDWNFTSRIRIKFTASGETDGGLQFGGSARVDHYDTTAASTGSATNGAAGEVYISGAFGKLSMGDVDVAPQAALGDVSGVGLTGLGDYNEIAYVSGNEDPHALYSYAMGDFGLFLSANSQGDYGIGANYTFGNFMVGAGYEYVDSGTSQAGSSWGSSGKMHFSDTWGNAASQWIIGADASFGDVTGKVRFARYDEDGFDGIMDQLSLSVDYTMGATTVTGYYANFRGGDGYSGLDADFYGVGASYDLGGGASLKGGVVRVDDPGIAVEETRGDFGVSFTF
ncbi:porin [Ostreiculturibacter nitratireducens]|uniref:porin n=1 Tax=Ostreiculturibacter nitratireducens TaxID=3075226 RepID=UPI0031B5A8E7